MLVYIQLIMADKMSITEQVAVQRAAAQRAKLQTFGIAGGGAQSAWTSPSGEVLVIQKTPETKKLERVDEQGNVSLVVGQEQLKTVESSKVASTQPVSDFFKQQTVKEVQDPYGWNRVGPVRPGPLRAENVHPLVGTPELAPSHLPRSASDISYYPTTSVPNVGQSTEYTGFQSNRAFIAQQHREFAESKLDSDTPVIGRAARIATTSLSPKGTEYLFSGLFHKLNEDSKSPREIEVEVQMMRSGGSTVAEYTVGSLMGSLPGQYGLGRALGTAGKIGTTLVAAKEGSKLYKAGKTTELLLGVGGAGIVLYEGQKKYKEKDWLGLTSMTAGLGASSLGFSHGWTGMEAAMPKVTRTKVVQRAKIIDETNYGITSYMTEAGGKRVPSIAVSRSIDIGEGQSVFLSDVMRPAGKGKDLERFMIFGKQVEFGSVGLADEALGGITDTASKAMVISERKGIRGWFDKFKIEKVEAIGKTKLQMKTSTPDVDEYSFSLLGTSGKGKRLDVMGGVADVQVPKVKSEFEAFSFTGQATKTMPTSTKAATIADTVTTTGLGIGKVTTMPKTSPKLFFGGTTTKSKGKTEIKSSELKSLLGTSSITTQKETPQLFSMSKFKQASKSGTDLMMDIGQASGTKKTPKMDFMTPQETRQDVDLKYITGLGQGTSTTTSTITDFGKPFTPTRLLPPPTPFFIPDIGGGIGFPKLSRRAKGKRTYRYTPTVVGALTGRTQAPTKDVGVQIMGIRYRAGTKKKTKVRKAKKKGKKMQSNMNKVLGMRLF